MPDRARKWQLNIDKHKGEKLENVLAAFHFENGNRSCLAVVMR